jgi:hypothetical protein
MGPGVGVLLTESRFGGEPRPSAQAAAWLILESTAPSLFRGRLQPVSSGPAGGIPVAWSALGSCSSHYRGSVLGRGVS